MLNERSQVPMIIYYVISFMCEMSRKDKTIYRSLFAKGWRCEWGLISNGYKGIFWSDENIPKLDYGDVWTIYKFTKTP